MMRVLIVSHYVPYFPGPGAPAREYCLAYELSSRHEITYLLPYHQAQEFQKVEALSSFCRVRFTQPPPVDGRSFGRRVQRRLDRLVQRGLPSDSSLRLVFGGSTTLREWQPTVYTLQQELARIDWKQFDLVQVEHSTLADALRGLHIPVPTLVTWHNIHSHVQERTYRSSLDGRQHFLAGLEWRRLRNYEHRIAGQVDRSIVMSELDRERLRLLEPSARVSIVPNGVNCDYFCNPEPGWMDSSSLVFTGLMDYEPNVEGVIFFCEQVLPQLLHDFPRTVFYIVGARPVPEVTRLEGVNPGRVVVTGTVDDVRPFLQRSTLCVVPLMNGGGTRLKILEAMSMQKAVVSTQVGCEGLDLTNGEEAVIINGAEQFAQAIRDLLNAPKERDRIAVNGYRLVLTKYDWKLIARSLEAAWEETVPSFI